MPWTSEDGRGEGRGETFTPERASVQSEASVVDRWCPPPSVYPGRGLLQEEEEEEEELRGWGADIRRDARLLVDPVERGTGAGDRGRGAGLSGDANRSDRSWFD